MITVSVQLKESSQPIVYKDVINTYQKGGLFVVYTSDERCYKHPLSTLWRIVEEYGYHGRPMDQADSNARCVCPLCGQPHSSKLEGGGVGQAVNEYAKAASRPALTDDEKRAALQRAIGGDAS